jgi:hypothetical protein
MEVIFDILERRLHWPKLQIFSLQAITAPRKKFRVQMGPINIRPCHLSHFAILAEDKELLFHFISASSDKILLAFVWPQTEDADATCAMPDKEDLGKIRPVPAQISVPTKFCCTTCSKIFDRQAALLIHQKQVAPQKVKLMHETFNVPEEEDEGKFGGIPQGSTWAQPVPC